MTSYSTLLNLNKQFLDFLNKDFPTENRDSYIEEINKFLEEREELIIKLKETDPAFDRAEMSQIIQSNKEIDKRLNQCLQLIKNDLKRINQRKKKNIQYSNPYESSSNLDGTFLDKRR
ncbi:flagellar protein FliT [Calidifontibacillus oryziterrae]|uniref:flagellar protein FliT n=1 Tax=Calidifontibacillus oryziterrae TaxID=1191699 RepID=UPI000302EB94|nr:flagellar protein FliT [Calidifontibacillus oryziterrae]